MVNIDKIKKLSKEQGLKLKFICQSLGVAESYLGDVKSGRLKMTDDRLAKIASLLHTTPEYLRDETDDPAPGQKEKTATQEDDDLSEIDKELVELLVSLTPEQSAEVMRYIDYLKSKG